LVVASVMSGIIGLGDVRKLGRPGALAVLYYLTTTVMAVLVGLVLVNLIQPGVGTVDQATLSAMAAEGRGVAAAQEQASLDTILRNLLLMLFTDNLFASAANTNLLPLIVFSVIFAGMLTTMGSRVTAISQMIVQVNDALLAFILLLMRLAPIGIFCLVTARFGEAQAEGNLMDVLQQTGAYFSTVLAGLALHALLTLPLILWIFTRRNPLRFMYQMSQALLTAFSTASSTATLPVTMECAMSKAGVSRRSAEFVLPLGATINMDGTALYEATAAIFIAQAIGVDLSLTQQIVVAVTATLAAIGAAGIPEAGLVTMIIVLNAVGLPVEYIGLILSVDWLLDRFRTAVNAFGDSVGSAVVDGAFAPE
jgi:solute carrier family 1 (high affinity glutamate transporter) protein 1